MTQILVILVNVEHHVHIHVSLTSEDPPGHDKKILQIHFLASLLEVKYSCQVNSGPRGECSKVQWLCDIILKHILDR